MWGAVRPPVAPYGGWRERLLEPGQLEILRAAVADAADNRKPRDIWLEVGGLLFGVWCEYGAHDKAFTYRKFLCGSRE